MSAVKDVLDWNGFGAPDAPDTPLVKVKKLVILIQQAPSGTLPDGGLMPALGPAPAFSVPNLQDIPSLAMSGGRLR